MAMTLNVGLSSPIGFRMNLEIPSILTHFLSYYSPPVLLVIAGLFLWRFGRRACGVSLVVAGIAMSTFAVDLLFLLDIPRSVLVLGYYSGVTLAALTWVTYLVKTRRQSNP